MGVFPARADPHGGGAGVGSIKRLASGIAPLDEFLEGGLPLGTLVEWGSPLGMGGRDVLLTWLARATRALPTLALWAHGRAHLRVYPPAWLARGVALEHVRFACTAQPVIDLRPVFLEPLFRLIVLDAPRVLTGDDCAFIARQARAHRQLVVLVRDAFLDSGRGNVWARLRINCRFDPRRQLFNLEVVRGLSPRRLELRAADLLAGVAGLAAPPAATAAT